MVKKNQTRTLIGTDQHVFIAGKTGTGKSELARAYLSQFPRVVMLDTKGDSSRDIKKGLSPWKQVPNENLTLVKNLSELPSVTTSHIIYEPVLEELNPIAFNEFFKWAYYHEDITVWVDEAKNISTSPQTIPEFYMGILTRGRTRNVAVWSLTQRPLGLHSDILSQCSHIFAFNLRLDQDREKLVKTYGIPEFETNPGGHSFWYAGDDWEHAIKGKLDIPEGR